MPKIRAATTLKVAFIESDLEAHATIRAALATSDELELVGVFDGAESALSHIPKLRPDVAVLHLSPAMDAHNFQLALELRRLLPDLGLAMLSDDRIISGISLIPNDAATGWCYLLKETMYDITALHRALQGAVDGMIVLDPSLISFAAEVPRSGLTRLTPRQLKTLQLMAEGFTNNAIAELRCVSTKAIEKHVTQIYHELGIDTNDKQIHPRIRAVNIYLTQHYIEPSGP